MPSKYKDKVQQQRQAQAQAQVQSGTKAPLGTPVQKVPCLSHKKSYESQYEAQKALLLRDNTTVPLRTYQCHECGKWYWTSKGS